MEEVDLLHHKEQAWKGVAYSNEVHMNSYCLLGCKAGIQSDRGSQAFQGNILPPSFMWSK